MKAFALLFYFLYTYLQRGEEQRADISDSRFRSELADNNVKKVSFKGMDASGECRQKIQLTEPVRGKNATRAVERFTTTMPAEADPALLAEGVDLTTIAKGTPGMTGADLENLVNEAAILASREHAAGVTMAHLEQAKDRLLMGGERTMVISDTEKRITAYHEAGHTLVAKRLPGTDTIHKVRIIPHGMALGVTQQLPEDDRYYYPRSYLEKRICVALGGRATIRLVFGEVSTGAQSDLKLVTDLAEKMVRQWGVSEKVGPVTFSRGEEHPFLGRKLAEEKGFSEAMAWEIDQEITAIVRHEEEAAEALLSANRARLDALPAALQEEETLDGLRVEAILQLGPTPAQ